ncbi:hypothetical protein [Methylorubrum sp. POS3]|uniref:hypothetical protein n=1 Tax=Methylorubrum sp. POS3 TaxID=2998492 RepID=UPI003727B1D3
MLRKLGASAVAFALLGYTLAFFIAYETGYYIEKAFAREMYDYSISGENIRSHLAISANHAMLSDYRRDNPKCCKQEIVFSDLYGNMTYLPMIHVMLQSEANDTSYLLDIFGDLRGFSGYSRSEGEKLEMRRKPFN